MNPITTADGRTIHAPTIHLNGTPVDRLIDAYRDASAAIRAALTALEEAAPNGRDYYPQGSDAATVVALEHGARYLALVNIRNDMYALCEYATDAKDAREATR